MKNETGKERERTYTLKYRALDRNMSRDGMTGKMRAVHLERHLILAAGSSTSGDRLLEVAVSM